jgi:hypothetical protein
MPRRASTSTIDALVREAMSEVVRRASQDIARAIADLAAAEISAQLEVRVVGHARGRPGAAQHGRARGDMTRWVADRRARRVPSFVIELTGLDTKKQIVARYGQDAVFEKGKPTPKAKS